LYKHLRRYHRKRKKRYGYPERRRQIPVRVSIDQRPDIVDAKGRSIPSDFLFTKI